MLLRSSLAEQVWVWLAAGSEEEDGRQRVANIAAKEVQDTGDTA
jgi:hypothetical protein